MKKAVLTIIISVIMIVTSACGNSKPNQLNLPVSEFEFTNQDEQTVSLEDLKGKVWITDLIFTYCETVCPTMTMNMAELQKQLKAAEVDAEIISFSVDPERDTPAALKSYLGKFGADFTNWNALTGYSYEEIKSFVLQSFKVPIAKDGASDQIIHGTYFYLVDQNGTVVAKYDGMEDTPFEKIINDVKALQKS
ncbi:SCO family protein [Paenibacillus sp. GSMTC-2017]|uniref:SCO family protein n=1 Tax=Paenibacillus sp. GSMTC-2017 TaxID=2794350 RepID=UPI003FA75DA3